MKGLQIAANGESCHCGKCHEVVKIADTVDVDGCRYCRDCASLEREGETCLCEVSNLQNGACTECGLPWFLPPRFVHTDQAELDDIRLFFERTSFVGKTANVKPDRFTMTQFTIQPDDKLYYSVEGIYVSRVGADRIARDFHIIETLDYIRVFDR